MRNSTLTTRTTTTIWSVSSSISTRRCLISKARCNTSQPCGRSKGSTLLRVDNFVRRARKHSPSFRSQSPNLNPWSRRLKKNAKQRLCVKTKFNNLTRCHPRTTLKARVWQSRLYSTKQRTPIRTFNFRLPTRLSGITKGQPKLQSAQTSNNPPKMIGNRKHRLKTRKARKRVTSRKKSCILPRVIKHSI